MGTVLLAVGLVASAFVAVNVGGSSTGVAFGPATGSGALGPRRAAVLLTLSACLGGVTLGPRVTATLGEEFVAGPAFTLGAAVVVLAVTGVGILLGNLLGVSVSTSATAVGAVVGLGVAVDAVRWGVVASVARWWVVSAVVGFWLAALAGRYAYASLAAGLERRSSAPTRRVALVLTGCGMAFAAGGSNVANAAGALVGADAVGMGPAVALACAGIGVGAVVFGPRTMATVGEGITDLPVAAALVVQTIAASLITVLNVAAVPASLAVTTTMCVIGFGWGRASRVADRGADAGRDGATEDRTPSVGDLYDERVTRRIVTAWLASPAVAALLAFAAVSAGLGR
jgi:PiT family inorganic phosphate transporter